MPNSRARAPDCQRPNARSSSCQQTDKFAGAYDPLNHKAICGGAGLCNIPLDAELGDFIGNQMAAANVGVLSVTVTRGGAGSGTVTGAGKINCGGACSTPLALGTAVTLTTRASSYSTFTGWTRDCAGHQAACTFTIAGENNVNANFDLAAAGGATSFKISISKNGNGDRNGRYADRNSRRRPTLGRLGWSLRGGFSHVHSDHGRHKSVTANFR